MLLAYFIKGSLVLMLAFFLCAALRRASAAARHLVWTVAFTALLLLPLLSRMTPVWSAPVAVSHAFPMEPTVRASVPAAPAAVDWISLVWYLGAALVASRFFIGSVKVWLRVRRAKPMQIDAPIPVLDGGPGEMPMTWGILRPVVLLPTEAAAWTPNRLRVVLLHELAHVDRRDCLTLAISELALALYWFHPLAWVGVRRMRQEREQACDDRVLAAGVAASDYAGDLIHIARGRRNSPIVAPAMARGSNLETRLKAILNPGLRRRAITRKMAVLVVGVALLALLPVAALRLQGQNTGLSGVVYDVSGAVIPDALVTVFNDQSIDSGSAHSGPDGRYSLPNLLAGEYSIVVRQRGFTIFERRRVAVPGKLDAVLDVGHLSESMTVSGRRSAPPLPAVTGQRIRVGGNVQAAMVIRASKPPYPASAEAAGIEGNVVLQGVVGRDGGMVDVKVVSAPSSELAEAALQAVRTWRYRPTLLNGEPVEVITTIDVTFRLDR